MIAVKWIALAILLGFSAYTVFCAVREPFGRSCRTVFSLLWGRQVVADLYLGLMLFAFIVYLNEGSLLTTMLWLIPMIVLGNIGTFAYFVFNFDTLARHFIP